MSIKIYTKTGDRGQTSLLGGDKVSKDNVRIESYGNIDELNSFVGLLGDQPSMTDIAKAQLLEVQHKLFTIGSLLSAPSGFKGFALPQVEQDDIEKLEHWIDDYDKDLPELKNFILPGGHQVVSLCHVCRTVCRRAERSIIKVAQTESISPEILKYINRLSDYFFILSRALATHLNVSESIWNP